MKKPFDGLDARTIDEALEGMLLLSPQERDTPDTQLVQDLQYLYRKEQILARAGQRLMLADQPESTDAPRSARATGTHAMLPGMFARELADTTPLPVAGGTKRSPLVLFSGFARIKRRVLVGMSAALTLVVIMAFALLAVSSLGRSPSVGTGSRPHAPRGTQSAEATQSVTSQEQGVTPGSTDGSITISNGQRSLAWPYGQSTYWANYRYHQLTGYWVQWTGNADQWFAGAREAGWHFSSSPHVPSIMVLMPYVQGAGEFGHVGVVESLVGGSTPSKVHTSNMDWMSNGGGFAKVSYYDFAVGPGVYFLWHG